MSVGSSDTSGVGEGELLVGSTVSVGIAVGSFVELSISWPVLLDETCPMRFIALGRILRCNGRKTVCSIDKYEFRTSGRTFQASVATRGDGMLHRWVEGVRKESLKVSAAGY